MSVVAEIVMAKVMEGVLWQRMPTLNHRLLTRYATALLDSQVQWLTERKVEVNPAGLNLRLILLRATYYDVLIGGQVQYAEKKPPFPPFLVLHANPAFPPIIRR